MAQPHKGPRRLTQARLPEPVYAQVKELADAAGTSVSQYVSDVMAVHVGELDEVREVAPAALLTRRMEVSPLASTG